MSASVTSKMESFTRAIADSSVPKGVLTAILTPLTATLEPDLRAMAKHARWLLDNGCDGLVLMGSTGEANSLSMRQRLDIVDGLVQAGLPVGRMVVGIGASALGDTVEYACHAIKLGIVSQLVLPPFFYKGPCDDGLFAFFASVIERINDSRLRLYLYHLPQITAVPISYALIQRLLLAFPGVIAGLKDSSGDWNYTQGLLQCIPRLAVYCGAEKFLMRNLRGGGAGCISGTFNFTAPMASRLRDALQSNGQEDEAERIQTRLETLGDLIEARKPIATLKALKAEMSGDDGWMRMLPPNMPLSPSERQEIVQAMNAVQPPAADGRGWDLEA